MVDAKVKPRFCLYICDPAIEGREGFVIDILRDALATNNHTMTFTIVPYKSGSFFAHQRRELVYQRSTCRRL
jgi:hypothetical protein